MEIEIFTLCDYAQDMKGKFVIVGTFDTIFPKQYPCNHPSCCIALRLRFSEDEQGEHKLKLRLIDQKGLEIVKPVEGKIQVKTPIKGHHSTVNFSLQFNQLKFETPGKYAFELYIDDDWRSGLPLLLTENMPAI
ncbi:MAG: hypothetical protein KA109_01535 [Saprospiraceae bacterium]|jgi:hypothetical protein|nr:hypothetical protein [Saprospiraceae bacterium]MBK7437321.1 hypothetical protein [Saprospiraceae bacterium]MBK7607354.1 hypothetical protein [Saprospiraceae bacterium]MBK8512646.1 hypothetical protein [Saprospiraceae bacterium]MBK9678455.1 hypothetical protein [Saprospiraceae bacterium]